KCTRRLRAATAQCRRWANTRKKCARSSCRQILIRVRRTAPIPLWDFAVPVERETREAYRRWISLTVRHGRACTGRLDPWRGVQTSGCPARRRANGFGPEVASPDGKLRDAVLERLWPGMTTENLEGRRQAHGHRLHRPRQHGCAYGASAAR